MDYFIISKQDYDTKVLDFMVTVEGNSLTAYIDSEGIPTIGIGVNLRANLDKVLSWFGVNMGNLSAADALIVAQIRTAVGITYSTKPSGAAALNNAIAPLFQKLSQKNRTSFAFNSDADSRNFFTTVMAPIYESKLQVWLTQNNLQELTGDFYSEERVVLFSLQYNTTPGSTTLLGTNLANALKSGDRLRAWFEIRYVSNLKKNQGTANRRYYESNYFGLWDDTSPTQTELDNFNDFLNQNDPNGKNISVLQLIRNYEADLDPHKRVEFHCQNIDEIINNPDVKAYFVAKYGRGQTIDGKVILGTELNNTITVTAPTQILTNAEIKNGYLGSTTLGDLILGGKGRDIIDGGVG
ncbi:MAG: hypothetical protein ABIK92_18930, partial [Pseudomonadota bacterium]